MPRPCKRRRICAKPSCGHFGPKDQSSEVPQVVTMTLDEFESIRLIDLEGMSQEQCAEQMNVARTTAQSIYGCARIKLAECLVNGKELKIEGGYYILCEGKEARTSCNHHGRQYCHYGKQERSVQSHYDLDAADADEAQES